jgi:hypothetical protein
MELTPETLIPTDYGDVPLHMLVHRYEAYKVQELKHREKRMEFLQTEEGKQYNRDHAKSYYERNKALVRAKAKKRYHDKKAQDSGLA